MPTTINGYHLWQLPVGSSKEPEESIEFTELENNLGNGYYSQVLYGANTGLRSWKLKLPTLAGSSLNVPTVTGINGETVSREQYVWDLFCETKITGDPFVYQSQRNSQYYLVRFADKRLSYEKMKVQLYSTGVELKQVRVPDVTVFSIEKDTNGLYAIYDESGHNSPVWERDDFTGAYQKPDMSITGDVVFSANPQNGLNTVRLSGSASTGFLSLIDAFDPIIFNDIFIVMKMREATFSNDCGILTKNTGTALLLGDSTETKFQNLALSGFEYRLNGNLFEQTNQQAPMNAFGVVHLRFETAQFSTNWQFGKDRGSAGTFALADIAQIVICSTAVETPIPRNVARELTEHLIVKWGIT